jgi:predicted porin
VRAGRITTPNFISSIRLNPFGDSTTFSPFNLHTYVGGQPMDASMASGGPAGISDSAHNSVLAYTSPNMGGFVAALNHSLAGGVGGQDKRVSYSLTYGHGPLLVSLSGESIKNPTLPAPPVVPAANQKQGQDTMQLGASYDLGTVKLFGQWNRTTVDLPSSAERRFRTVQLGAAVPVGAGKLLASVAQTRKDETGLSDLQRTTWSVGYDHTLSKRTDLYAVYMNDRLTGLTTGNTFAVGMRHRF